MRRPVVVAAVLIVLFTASTMGNCSPAAAQTTASQQDTAKQGTTQETTTPKTATPKTATQAENPARRIWTNRFGSSQEAEFTRLMPGGIAMFKSASNRAERVALNQLADPDQIIAKQLYLASLPDRVTISPFGDIAWSDSPNSLLTKLKNDGYERISAKIINKKGREEYDVIVVLKPAAEGAPSTEEKLELAGIPFDASIGLVGIQEPVMSSDWKLVIQASPVWIEGEECVLRATFESNYGLLVDQRDALDKAPLPDDGIAGNPKECLLPCLLAEVVVEFPDTPDAASRSLSTTAIKSLYAVMLDKYGPLLEGNLQLASLMGAKAGENPDTVEERAKQIAASLSALPVGENRARFGDVFQGSDTGFSIFLGDEFGHRFNTSIGKTPGTRSSVNIRYDVGTSRRMELQRKSDEAKFRTSSGGKNRVKDI